MTGTIKSLDSASATGVIMSAEGEVFGFYLSVVLAYDLPLLAVGQAVTFDLESGRFPKALNVCVQRVPDALNETDGRAEIKQHLRYMGFQQVGSIRSYNFESQSRGEQRSAFTVNGDLELFAKHRVGLQEGPGICLHRLAAEADLPGAGAATPFQCSLTDREMLAYLASRPVHRAKHGVKRGLRPAGAAAHAG
jgi:cold shock CspA family protein